MEAVPGAVVGVRVATAEGLRLSLPWLDGGVVEEPDGAHGSGRYDPRHERRGERRPLDLG